MNKIVREHYPVERLPPDLRVELVGQSTVTVTIEADDQRATPPEKPQFSITDVLAQAKRLRDAGVIKRTTPQEAVARIRALRDEWEDR